MNTSAAQAVALNLMPYLMVILFIQQMCIKLIFILILEYLQHTAGSPK